MLTPEEEQRLAELGLTQPVAIFDYAEANGWYLSLGGPRPADMTGAKWSCGWYLKAMGVGHSSPTNIIGYGAGPRDALARGVLAVIDVEEMWRDIREKAKASGEWYWGQPADVLLSAPLESELVLARAEE